MSGNSDPYLWIGPSGGLWLTAADWEDLANPPGHANTPPGATNAATINGGAGGVYLLVDGPGTIGALTIGGDVALGGSLSAAGVTLPTANVSLLVSANATLTTGTIALAGLYTSLLDNGLLVAALASLGTDTTLSVANGGSARLAGVVLQGGALALTDTLSTLEIGTAGAASAGAITIDTGTTLSGTGAIESAGNIVVNGTILAAALSADGTLAGNGQVIVQPGGAFDATGAVAPSSTLSFTVGNAGTLSLPGTLGAGNAIALAGTADILELGLGAGAVTGGLAVAAPITGLAVGDAILIGEAVSALSYLQGGATGTLTLLAAGGSAIGSLVVAGSHALSDFLLTPIGVSALTQIDLAQPGSFATPNNASSHQYAWSGPIGGAWANPANWTDLTTGGAATTAPGANNAVTITGGSGAAYQVVSGGGTSSSLGIGGDVALSGSVSTGILTLATLSSVLQLDPGSTLSALDLVLSASYASVVVDGTGALLTAGQIAPSGLGASVAVVNGGSARATALALQGGSELILTGSLSSFELGTLGGAAAGAVTVDAGSTLSGTGAINSTGSIVDNGAILATGLSAYGTLAGRGTVQVAAGGAFTEVTAIAASATIAFAVAAGGALNLPLTVGAHDTITLTGSTDLLQFGAIGPIEPGLPATFGLSSTIAGFSLGDSTQIEFGGTIATAALVQSGGVATLTLRNTAGTKVGNLLLRGTYTGASILLTQIASNASGTETQINLAETGSFSVSAGTSGPDRYQWIGPAGGAWGDTKNWQDLTSGFNPAAIAAGAADLVTIPGGTQGAAMVLTGTGASASLSATGNAALDGNFSTGTLTLATGALVFELGAAATLAAGSIQLSGLEDVLQIQGSLATLTVAGTTNLANSDILEAENGGDAALASVVLQQNSALASDAASVLEIGTLGGAAAGALTIDTGATVSGNGEINAPTLSVNGHIAAAAIAAYGTLGGSGTVSVQAGGEFTAMGAMATGAALDFTVGATATLTLPTAIGAGNTIALGPASVLAFGLPGQFQAGLPGTLAVGATISGFTTGDTMLLTFGAAVAGIGETFFAGTDTLTLSAAGGSSLGTLLLAGTHAGRLFQPTELASSPFGAETELTLVPCFVAGALIATQDGPRPVETITPGTLVLTASGRARPVRWVGQRRIDLTRHSRPALVSPIRLRAGAFGNRLPRRDLLLSPDHSVFVEGRLYPAGRLVNGASIVRERLATVQYLHLELDRHDVLLAEGLPVESYLDTGNRTQFDSCITPPRTKTARCAPLCLAGPALERLRRRLAAIAWRMGWRPDNSDLRVLVNGRPVPTARRIGPRRVYVLPRPSRRVTLASPSGESEGRSLGIALGGIVMDGRPLPLDGPACSAGFHDLEQCAGYPVRWTDGVGELALPAGRVLELLVREMHQGWRHG